MFVHLHLHSQYSTLDGAVLIPDLIKQLNEYQMTSCAITDHGTMSGIIEFYEKMKTAKLHPLIGIETYCTMNPDNTEDKIRDNYHLLLIAKNNQGYKQLLKLSSEAYLYNFYYRPRIYFEKLKELTGNVIVTSACMGGILSAGLEYTEDQLIDRDNRSDQLCFDLKCIFKDDFYLELQEWNDPTGQLRLYNKFILQLGKKYNIPFVITNDVHYLNKDDYLLHEIMMAMQMKMTINDYRNNPKTLHYGSEFYLKNPKEMLQAAKELDCEEAYWNTEKIAQQCNVEIELGKYYLPKFNITKTKDYQEFLKENNGK